MKLRALHLTNVRKFTGKRAAITGIGNGITVVSEANEFGKSTFFDALHALFFEKFGSTARPVKSLQPYAGGAVEVGAEVETDQGRFLVEKRFLSKKMARIVRLSDGATIAQDDEAERWIGTLLGAAEGPAGLLWVRQGLVGMEPDSQKEKTAQAETRRNLLSGEIDAMTGGRRMDRVMRQLGEDLAGITTKTGRKSGAWKAAADEAEALGAELARLTAQVATLETALTDRKSAEATLARLDDPDARARRDTTLQAAQTAMEIARAHAGQVAAAQQDDTLAALQTGQATAALDSFLAAIAALTEARAAALDRARLATTTEADAAALKDFVDAASAAHDAARQAVATARATLDSARHQTEARKARAEAARLGTQIAKARAAQDDRDTARARVKASAATAEWLRGVEAAEAEVAKAEAALQAQATTLRISYTGTARIALNGTALPDDQAVVVNGAVRLDLPGIGTLTLQTHQPADTSAARLATAQAKRDAALRAGEVTTIDAARRAAAARAEADRQVRQAQAVLDTLAPDGLDALAAALAEAGLAAAAAHDLPLPALADLQSGLAALITAEDHAAGALQGRQADHAALREAAVRARSAAEAAAQVLDRAKAAASEDSTRENRRTDLLRVVAQTGEVQARAAEKLGVLTAAAPDLATTDAELRRATDAVAGAARQRQETDLRRERLSAEIRTAAGNGIEERRDDIAGQLETARAADARFARKAAALTRLQAALEAERRAAQDTYFGPVQAELKPLLAILHRDAALTFDTDSLLPTGLTRGLAAETLEDLSGGTREQIAILTRLAFARLFARAGRHLPIVLDDALVYSDDDRIIKMFTALTRVAQDQQIIVFSCRQLAFQDLGGARPGVAVTEVL